MAEPTELPNWSGESVSEPDEDKKDVGWVSAERPAIEYLNWLWKNISDWLKWFRVESVPIIQYLTVGSGTYTVPVGAKWLRVRIQGPGGAGATSGSTSGGFTVGSVGAVGETWFDSNITWYCGGGDSPTSNDHISGGQYIAAGSDELVVAVQGNSGDVIMRRERADRVGFYAGGAPSYMGTPATASVLSGYGAGGRSGVQTSTSSWGIGLGGSSGAYIEIIIRNPASSYAYSVGAGQTAAPITSGGSNGSAGQNGADGVIIVEVYYV